MFVDRPNILLEKLGQQSLRQPDSLIFQPHIDLDTTILVLVDEKLARVDWVAIN